VAEDQDDICEFSDLLKVTCAHCIEREVRTRPSAVSGITRGPARESVFRTAGQAFAKVAEFYTSCPGCDESIEPGDRIKQDADGSWNHEDCT
jgi:hypothetical protein